MTLRLVIEGPPPSKGRPRSTRSGRVYTPPSTRDAEENIRRQWLAAGRPAFKGRPALAFGLVVSVARPKRKHGPVPIKRPDLDNVAKLFCDALNGLAWADDAQFVSLRVSRHWAPEGQPGSCVLCVREWDGE